MLTIGLELTSRETVTITEVLRTSDADATHGRLQSRRAADRLCA